MLAWILEHAGLDPGFLIGGVPAELRRLGAARRDGAVLRHRGRRVRHRVLRQALQVRALPSAHRDPQQSRVRPRRHLPRPCRDRDAVPPPRAHRAGTRPTRRQRRATTASQRVLARGCWSRWSVSAARAAGTRGARLEPIAARRRVAARQASLGRLSPLALLGRAQPAERARRDRRRAPRRRAGPREPRPRSRASTTSSAASSCAAPSAASPSTTTSRTTRPRSRATLDGLRAQGRRRAHPRRARAALEHDEARRDEGRARREPRGSRPRLLLRGEPRLGRRGRRSRRWASAYASQPTSTRWSARSPRQRGRATTCWS